MSGESPNRNGGGGSFKATTWGVSPQRKYRLLGVLRKLIRQTTNDRVKLEGIKILMKFEGFSGIELDPTPIQLRESAAIKAVEVIADVETLNEIAANLLSK